MNSNNYLHGKIILFPIILYISSESESTEFRTDNEERNSFLNLFSIQIIQDLFKCIVETTDVSDSLKKLCDAIKSEMYIESATNSIEKYLPKGKKNKTLPKRTLKGNPNVVLFNVNDLNLRKKKISFCPLCGEIQSNINSHMNKTHADDVLGREYIIAEKEDSDMLKDILSFISNFGNNLHNISQVLKYRNLSEASGSLIVDTQESCNGIDDFKICLKCFIWTTDAEHYCNWIELCGQKKNVVSIFDIIDFIGHVNSIL